MLPAALRRRSGLGAHDLVLIAADCNHDVLVVHPLTALDTIITTYHVSHTTSADGQANAQATVASGGR